MTKKRPQSRQRTKSDETIKERDKKDQQKERDGKGQKRT